jgi:hypothetical protein
MAYTRSEYGIPGNNSAFWETQESTDESEFSEDPTVYEIIYSTVDENPGLTGK